MYEELCSRLQVRVALISIEQGIKKWANLPFKCETSWARCWGCWHCPGSFTGARWCDPLGLNTGTTLLPVSAPQHLFLFSINTRGLPSAISDSWLHVQLLTHHFDHISASNQVKKKVVRIKGRKHSGGRGCDHPRVRTQQGALLSCFLVRLREQMSVPIWLTPSEWWSYCTRSTEWWACVRKYKIRHKLWWAMRERRIAYIACTSFPHAPSDDGGTV